MSVRKILKLGHPDLCKICSKVENIDSDETRQIIQDLKDTLNDFIKHNGFGRAIAAPQIGVQKRILYFHFPKENLSGPLINPRITWRSPETLKLWDDCFSFPELLVKVERARMVEVDYTFSNGEKLSLSAKGDLSELLQHEIDHLDGILAVHRATGADAFSLRAEWEEFWKELRVDI